MQPESLEEAWDWLTRATRDLLIAQRALQGEPVLADQAVYHAHQAAENALKAYLSAQSIPFPKTHDLVRLVSLCREVEASFAHWLPAAQTLNPYVTQFRYPGGPLEPERSEAEEANRLAGELLSSVRRGIPQLTEH
ncbi:MAG: HEPN domain-containing protein [Thermomicrobiales bacterium]